MIDTIAVTISEYLPDSFLREKTINEDFDFNGFTARLVSSQPGSHYEKRGAKLILTLWDPDRRVRISGPVFSDVKRVELTTVRINTPKLIGLDPGCLPITNTQLEYAWAMAEWLIPWMPKGWLDRAKVKELHVAMNFSIAPEWLIDCHKTMRHPRVRPDPAKFHPSHGSLYWRGKNLVICLYDKKKELVGKLKGKPGTDELVQRLPQLSRLEFRLKAAAIQRELDRDQPVHELKPGVPPPSKLSSWLAPKAITSELLLKIFRDLVGEFPRMPVRVPERICTPTVIAMLHNRGAVLADGTSVLDFYAGLANEKNVRRARALASKVFSGAPIFHWNLILGPSGWGDCARPVIVLNPPAQLAAP